MEYGVRSPVLLYTTLQIYGALSNVRNLPTQYTSIPQVCNLTSEEPGHTQRRKNAENVEMDRLASRSS